jgi:hypothetical protein
MARTLDLFPAITSTGEVVYATLREATALNLALFQRATARLLGALLRRMVRASLDPPSRPVPSVIVVARLAVLAERKRTR